MFHISTLVVLPPKLTLSHLLVRGAVHLGASRTTCGGGTKLLSPAQQQVTAGGVTGPLRAVVAALSCCHHGCWEEDDPVSLHAVISNCALMKYFYSVATDLKHIFLPSMTLV